MGSPFDSGKTLVFKSMSTAGSRRYLNSWAAYNTRSNAVYLEDSMDFTKHPGCHWEAEKLDDGTYSLKSMSTSSNRRYLDSWAASPNTGDSIYLDNDNSGGGSHWRPTQLPDDSYSLQSQSPSGPKRYLNSNPAYNNRGQSVYLVENTNSVGTHWMVGVDYYSGKEVERIIYGVYPDITIKFYQADPKYGSLDYDLLFDIWKDSGLGNYRWKANKFDCDDFAVCLKGEVAKYSYKQVRPDDKGSLCGIMWGRNARGAHAFNFTIDPFKNLILFEPQNGKQMAPDAYTPYFCVV